MKRVSLCYLAFMLACLLPTTAEAQVNKRVLLAGKGATGLVLLDGNRGSGSCFCIDAEGYFVTNAHVVRGEIGATLIMNPNTEQQFELKAKVVVSDSGSDLALLKADMGKHKVTPLRLADSEKLTETDELIAFGFPLGELLAFDEDEYPAVSINVGRVTSLRRADGNLEAIQTDTTLTFGNSGGPMLDKNGDIAGVVVAGLPGLNINFAIPTSKIDKLLKMPAVSVTLPEKIPYGKRYEPVGVKIDVDDISKTAGAGPFSVKVIVGDGEDAKTVKAMGRGGSFVAGIQPAEKPKGEGPADEEYEVDLQFDTGSMTVKLQNVPLRVGKHRVKLQEVALVEKRGDTYRVIKTDGTELEGRTLTGPTVTTEFAGERTRVSLSKATWIRVFHDGLEQGRGFVVPLTIEVSRGGEVVAMNRAALRVEDPPKLDLPDVPSGDTDEPSGESDSDRGTPPTRISKEAYVFDAKRNRTLKDWQANIGMPQTSRGQLVFEGNNHVELTYKKQMLLGQMTIEYEAGNNMAFTVLYGENAYRVHVSGSWFGMSNHYLNGSNRYDRTETRSELNLEGRKQVTIDFREPSITTMQVDKAVIARKMRDAGEIKIIIDNRNPIKIHRIEMLPLTEKRVATASDIPSYLESQPVAFNEKTIRLPAEYGSVYVGGAGRYMLFHVPSRKTIEIIDVLQGTTVHSMPNVSDDVMIAAGLKHFVLVLPGQNLMQKWSYEGFKREKVARIPTTGMLWNAALGANSTGPMVLSADNNLFVDLESMRAQDVTGRFWAQFNRHRHQIKASADGRVYMNHAAAGRNNYMRLIRHHEGFVWSHEFSGKEQTWQLDPSADGRLIFARSELFDQALNTVSADWLKDWTCYPTVDPRYFLAVRLFDSSNNKNTHRLDINICTVADRRALFTVNGFPEVTPRKHHTTTREVSDRLRREPSYHFHYVPWAEALITIGWDKKTVVIRKLNLIDKLESQGVDYLFVQSTPPVFAPRNGKLSYQIDVVSSSEGITYEFFDGPEGCAVSDTGLVTWDIPAFSENERETIILSVRNKAGEEVLHSFDLTYQ
ncbi:MAG: serine protease [Planctomycetota bacterium]